MSNSKAWAVAVVSFLGGLCFVITLGVFTAPVRPHFAIDEARFLEQIKNSRPSDAPAGDTTPWVAWPDDDELVREAHATCQSLDSSHGNWEQAFRQRAGVDLIARYPYGQSLEMIAQSASHLCPRWRFVAASD